MKSLKFFLISIFASLLLVACSNSDQKNNQESMDNIEKSTQENSSHGGHEGMNHTGSADVPEGLKVAQNPKYKVGDTAIINADHMEGMKGAEATIVGAYDTIAYVISYDPIIGGERVTNHKWVIHEEIRDPRNAPYKSGEEVTVEADHMEGMKGAIAVVESAEKTTVYMVDYIPTNGGEKVTNHKWVTESELSDK
ncbi:DUF1541 domain-containing protein [Neobacillus sp. D3-1R]|uniref:DUF1541 domain-containing protein n=1 Tax=Neobacillus sp. D3-1R TaxID=3445778 RepID=UPI003F9F9813